VSSANRDSPEPLLRRWFGAKAGIAGEITMYQTTSMMRGVNRETRIRRGELTRDGCNKNVTDCLRSIAANREEFFIAITIKPLLPFFIAAVIKLP